MLSSERFFSPPTELGHLPYATLTLCLRPHAESSPDRPTAVSCAVEPSGLIQGHGPHLPYGTLTLPAVPASHPVSPTVSPAKACESSDATRSQGARPEGPTRTSSSPSRFVFFFAPPGHVVSHRRDSKDLQHCTASDDFCCFCRGL